MRKPDDEMFISPDDGWTLPFYFAPVPAVHGEIRGTYRPCLPAERAKILECLGRTRDDEEAALFISKALAARIRSWNLEYNDTSEDGKPRRKPAPITEEFVRRLKFPIWDKLTTLVIYQTKGCDRDPKWSEEDASLHEDAAFLAALTGTPAPAAMVETMEKNSLPG